MAGVEELGLLSYLKTRGWRVQFKVTVQELFNCRNTEKDFVQGN